MVSFVQDKLAKRTGISSLKTQEVFTSEW